MSKRPELFPIFQLGDSRLQLAVRPFRIFSHGTAEQTTMDGLSRWDLVLWFVVAYAAVMILVRLMLNHREIVLRRLRDQVATSPRRNSAAPPAEERRDAA
jgi:hypothetical protein